MGTLIKDMGERPFVFSLQEEIRTEDEYQIVLTGLRKHSAGCIIYDEFHSLPGYDQMDSASYFLRRSGADLVVAIGGRHTFQVARSLAILSRNEVYASELKAKKFPLRKPPMSVVCIPTGLTIGEESSPDMFGFDSESGDFFYHRDHRLFPEAILVDPAVVASPARTELVRQAMAIIAASVESILSRKSNEITGSLSLKAIELVVRSINTLMTDQANQGARYNLSVASIVCGMAQSSTGLGLSYSIAQAVHLVAGMDFYSALNILLPHVMEYNLTSSASKYVQIARALDQDIHDISIIEAAIKAVEGVRKLYLDLNVPQRLSDFEIPKSSLGDIASLAAEYPLIRNTPRDMERNEVETILITAY
jgi:alcohol dehydrogenase